MGSASSRGDGSSTKNKGPPDVHKKGIAALIKPLRPPGLQLRPGQSISEFNVMSLANNLSQRFSVLSGLSFISLASAPASSDCGRKKITRTRYRGGSISGPGKTAWPVAQTELLFLPEFPVGTDQKMQLIFYGEISRGAFGQVFHVQCNNSLKHYAMKVLAKSQVCSLDVVKQVKQEVMIQQMCSHHPFITPLTHHWQTRKLLIVMTEYVAFGELHQLWQSLGTLPEKLVALYVAEIAVTLDFLHNAGVMYRDLKMENLLLDEDGHIKLIDFGLAKWVKYGSKTGSICGTLHLMAPEVCHGTWYSHSVDWWSLGIIAYCLVTGKYPLPLQLNHAAMLQAIAKCDYNLPPSTSPALKSLVEGLLHRDPLERTHTLLALQQEQIYKGVDLASVVEKKVSPRKLLEEYIESKTRQNFEDFAGLTSTPKKHQKSSVSLTTSENSCEGIDRRRPQSSTPAIAQTGLSSPSLIIKSTGGNPALGFHKRSVSSPLLHPGRLGHHDAVTKYSPGGVGATNGAAVPILQSPLLRLAREHCMKQHSTYLKDESMDGKLSGSFFNIGSLSNTSSPSILRSQKVREKKMKKKPPCLNMLQQELTNTFASLRISSSINEISCCDDDSSSSASCERLFKSHSYHTYSTNKSGLSNYSPSKSGLNCNRDPTDYATKRSSFNKSSSSISSHKINIPFVSTLPTIASSPLPPSSPASSTSPGRNRDESHPPGYDLFLSNMQPQSFFPPNPLQICNSGSKEVPDHSKFFSNFDDDNLAFIDASTINAETSKITLSSLIANSSLKNQTKLTPPKPFFHSPSAPHLILPQKETFPLEKQDCGHTLTDSVVIPSLSVWSPSPSETTNTDDEGKSNVFNFIDQNEVVTIDIPIQGNPEGEMNNENLVNEFPVISLTSYENMEGLDNNQGNICDQSFDILPKCEDIVANPLAFNDLESREAIENDTINLSNKELFERRKDRISSYQRNLASHEDSSAMSNVCQSFSPSSSLDRRKSSLSKIRTSPHMGYQSTLPSGNTKIKPLNIRTSPLYRPKTVTDTSSTLSTSETYSVTGSKSDSTLFKCLDNSKVHNDYSLNLDNVSDRSANSGRPKSTNDLSYTSQKNDLTSSSKERESASILNNNIGNQ